MENSEKPNHYDVFEVIDTFKIEKIKNCTVLKEWISANGNLNAFENELIIQAREELDLKWDEWNEEELKMHFVILNEVKELIKVATTWQKRDKTLRCTQGDKVLEIYYIFMLKLFFIRKPY